MRSSACSQVAMQLLKLARRGGGGRLAGSQKGGFFFQPRRCFVGGSSSSSGMLREMNKRGDAEGVIRGFESGKFGFTEEGVKEYVRALVAVDRLDKSSLFKTVQAGLSAQTQPQAHMNPFGAVSIYHIYLSIYIHTATFFFSLLF